MNRYLVTLDFAVAYGQCDQTPGQTPPGTPEEIAAQTENMTLVVISEGSQQCRHYRVELSVKAETSEGKLPLSRQIVGLFNHLPGYETISLNVVEAPGAYVVPEPLSLAERQAAAAKSGRTGPFRVQCLFRSVLPFEALQTAFAKHIAGGNLVSNADRHAEYVAFVDLDAVSADGLDDAAHTLLARAFGAESEESFDNFQPITTKVL